MVTCPISDKIQVSKCSYNGSAFRFWSKNINFSSSIPTVPFRFFAITAGGVCGLPCGAPLPFPMLFRRLWQQAIPGMITRLYPGNPVYRCPVTASISLLGPAAHRLSGFPARPHYSRYPPWTRGPRFFTTGHGPAALLAPGPKPLPLMDPPLQ